MTTIQKMWIEYLKEFSENNKQNEYKMVVFYCSYSISNLIQQGMINDYSY